MLSGADKCMKKLKSNFGHVSWALVNIELLIMGHYVTIQPELSIMS